MDFYGIKPSSVIESQNTDNCLNLAESGHGISFIPELYTWNRPPLKDAGIYAVDDEKVDYTRYVYFHKEKKSPAKEDLLAIIQDVCQELQAKRP